MIDHRDLPRVGDLAWDLSDLEICDLPHEIPPTIDDLPSPIRMYDLEIFP